MSHLRATKIPPPGFSRRRFLQGLSASAGLLVLSTPSLATNVRPRLVIIGGGAGGSAVVRALQAHAPGVFDITVVTDQKTYNAPYALHGFTPNTSSCTTAPIDIAQAFRRQGASVIAGRVEHIEITKKTIRLVGENTPALNYDVLITAPGIALNWDQFNLKGTPDTAAIWTSASTCKDLLNTLQQVPTGGTFALVAPAGPHRCPPAVYERACFAAFWFKAHNKTAKILIIDEKDQYPMQALFEEAYADYYEDMIEWIPREFHGGVTGVDLEKGKIQTDSEIFQADSLNVIPPQQAPEFLITSGLTGKDFYCQIRTSSMQSALSKDIYVIGDAASAGEISKSAMSAGVQARLAAADIIRRYVPQSSQDKIDISDNCWTLVAPDDAISLGGTYTATDEHFTSTQRFMSVVDDSADLRKSNATKAQNWPNLMVKSLYGA